MIHMNAFCVAVFICWLAESEAINPTCNGVSDCSIDCIDVNCENATIDASLSTDLTLYCYPSSNCSQSIIYCASSSCIINCGYNCNSMVINANTTTTLTVNCQYDDACNSMIIWAENAGSIIFNTSNYTEYVKIHGENAKSISISCVKEGSCTHMTVWATYAQSFSLIAKYYGAYSFGAVYASEANSVSITCASAYRDFAACNGYWKLSDYGHNTAFYCYGDGCRDLGTIGVDTNASSLTIAMNGCNECSDINKCIGELQISCNAGSDTFKNRYCNGGSDSKCGCDALLSNGISFTDNENQCVDVLPVWLYYGSAGKISGTMIIIFVAAGVGVLCILIFCCYIQCIYESKSGDDVSSGPIIPIIDEDDAQPVSDDINSIIILQERSWSNHSYDFGCKPPRIPQWSSSTINAFLMQSGLTQDILNEEIQIVNDKSNEYIKSKCGKCHYFGTIAWIGFILSIIIIIALGSAAPPEKQDFYRMLFLIPWFFGLIGVIVYYYARREQERIWNECSKYIETHIMEINERYSDLGINWSLQKIKVRHKNKCKARNKSENWYIATYNDILISAVQQKQAISYNESQQPINYAQSQQMQNQMQNQIEMQSGATYC